MNAFAIVEHAILPGGAVLAAAVRDRITSGRLEGFSEWWQPPLAAAASLVVLAIIVWLYRRDSAELPPGLGVLLAALRLGAVAAIAVAWLDFDRTTETEVVFPSRVAVLFDSSASMTLEDAGAGAKATAGDPARTSGLSRSSRGVRLLEEGGLIEALRRVHEVSLWRFDADAEPLVVLPSRGIDGDAAPAGEAARSDQEKSDESWKEKVLPRGFETRIGESIDRVLGREPQRTLAGVIVISDGGSNAGVDPAAAAAVAAKAAVPIVAIGFGSERLPVNVRVADLVAPSRVYPGDRFSVTGYLQPQGLEGRTVKVELAEAASGEKSGAGRVIDAKECVLGKDGELATVRFDVPGFDAPGRRGLVVRVAAPPGDSVATDDAQASEIEVVDRMTQVLLMAGGPSREYQFMRNVLERDKSFAVDVLLATARKGTSQDARTTLSDFPQTPESLNAYDAIVAFDYDWRRLDPQELGRLERWVSRESGGLVLVSGNIFMDAWLAEPACNPVRSLYPLDLTRTGSGGAADREKAGEEAMPLDFSPDGLEAEFLWLGSTRVASQAAWAAFPGVYGCYDATVPKPGATVFARARRSGGGRPGGGPVFLAGQYYGSGTVVSAGSGELWRLRGIDDAAYERIVTQLVRHVSQGRLLRGSNKVRLLVDRDRFAVGGVVAVRVVMPEGKGSADTVPDCRALGPDGAAVVVRLEADPLRPGEFSGSFVAGREGTWRIELTGGGDENAVTRSIQARLPERELEKPRLERGLLEQMATAAGGRAFFPDEREWKAADAEELIRFLPDRTRREYQSGAPDRVFKERLNTLLLAAAAGLLCVEWIVRRLARLA